MSSLNFFFWTVWSSDSAGRRSVREHAEPFGVRIAWRGRSGGYDPCRRQTVQKKIGNGGAPMRRSVFPRPGRGPAAIGSGNWFPARGVQRTLTVLWTPEAPPAGGGFRCVFLHGGRTGRSATVRPPCGPSSFSSCAAWSGTSRASMPCALRAPRHRRRAGCPLRRCSPRTVRRTME